MLREGSIAMPPAGFAAEKKDADSSSRWEKRADDFRQAVSQTLIETLAQKKKGAEAGTTAHFTAYEKSLLEKPDLQINMLIDIDGVLIDTEKIISEIIDILTRKGKLMENIRAAKDKVTSSKIPFSSRRTLLECRDNAAEIVLVTDRFGKGPCCFPCFNEKSKQVFTDHGIGVSTGNYKFLPILSKEDRFLPMIAAGDITYYLGSSESDRKYVEKIRELMEKASIPQEKLMYIHIELPDHNNIL